MQKYCKFLLCYEEPCFQLCHLLGLSSCPKRSDFRKMHHYYLREISTLLKTNLISLALLHPKPNSSSSVKILAQDHSPITRLYFQANPFFCQHCSLEVYIILPPVDIQDCLDLLIVFRLEDEVTGAIQSKIVATVTAIVEVNLVLLLHLLNTQLLRLCPVHLFRRRAVGLYFSKGCGNEISQCQHCDESGHYISAIIIHRLITVNQLICIELLHILEQLSCHKTISVVIVYSNIMSHNKSLSLAKLEQSILREYKRVSYGEQTPHYDVQSIYYSDLPKELPSFLSETYKKSIILYNYSFFEMLTFAVLEYLFTCQTTQKKSILERIKGKICNEDFMFGSNFIKGLMIKGLRAIIDKRNKSNKPIAQILMKNEAMNAFSEFWKEIIEEESSEACAKHTDIPESQAYQHVSNFLGVDFKLLRKHQNQYKEETVASKLRISAEPITIVMFDRNLMESIINKVFQQNIGSEETERGYILLLTSQHAEKNSILPFSHEKSARVEFDELSERAKAVTKKGNELLNKFRQMYREMRETLD